MSRYIVTGSMPRIWPLIVAFLAPSLTILILLLILKEPIDLSVTSAILVLGVLFSILLVRTPFTGMKAIYWTITLLSFVAWVVVVTRTHIALPSLGESLGNFGLLLVEVLSVTLSQLTIIAAFLSILASLLVIYRMSRRNDKAAREKPRGQEVIRAEKRRQVTNNLTTHYALVIGRMEDWDYWPKASGEMITSRSSLANTTVPNKIPSGGIGIPPLNLKQNLEHLEMFSEAWSLYSNGPKVAEDLNRKRKEALDRISAMVDEGTKRMRLPRIYEQPLHHFTEMIFAAAREDAITESRHSGSFNEYFPFPPPGKSYRIADSQFWVIGGAGGVTLATTQEVAERITSILEETRNSKEIEDIVKSVIHREALLSENREAFLKTLLEDVISRTKNSVYTNEISKGVCEDCNEMKSQLDALDG